MLDPTALIHDLTHILSETNTFLWGAPAMVMLLGGGIYLSMQLRFIQFRSLKAGLKLAFGKPSDGHHGSISRFGALATCLSGTIGTGNIAGIAIAVSMGGPGALFWIWLSALLGMATKYASCTLAVRYRQLAPNGDTMGGGPMYTLRNALNMPKLGTFFAVITLLASFSTGNAVQANSIANGLEALLPTQHHLMVGIILSLSTALVVLGGVKRIAKMATIIVPFMAVVYIIAGLVILILHYKAVPHALFSIFNLALNPHAASGAALGMAMQYGLSRGIFSSEAGLGTAPIAHAAANTESPSQQGLVAMTDPLFNTLMVCTITGLVILVAPGAYGTHLQGAALSAAAFQHGLAPLGMHLPIGDYVVALGLIFFAYTTIVTWCYYGEQCLHYLLGDHHPLIFFLYRIVYSLILIPGAILPLKLVWQLADLSNFLMAVPNILSLILLTKVVKQMTREHEAKSC